MEQALKNVNSGKLRAWYQASRAPFFVATLVPLALAGVIAYKQGGWNTARWLVICLASFLVHMNTNLANDYFDFLSGADAGDSIGGSRVLQDGKLTLSEIRWRHDLVLSSSAVVRIMDCLGHSIMVAGHSRCYSRSSPAYSIRLLRSDTVISGLGELFVGINMGPIMVAGGSGCNIRPIHNRGPVAVAAYRLHGCHDTLLPIIAGH